ncbi:Phosphoglucomutase/phosphomannomutase [Candidatus Tiddalikarchaeum anstoanum]|nr:Phosphoglucomutase/phosphomannomutase [Candidatus Tiddalikarchaeum anstoanum]
MANAFKSYDIRGVYNKELLPEDVFKVGLCHADLVKQKVCIGYDSRTTSETITNIYAAGFTSGGFDIVIIGMAPTPVCNYYSMLHKIDSVVVTGSHTPPEYNGIKFFDKLGIMYNERLRKLEQKYLTNDYKRANWDDIGKITHDNNAIKEYTDFITSKIRINRKLKIVIDYGNGTGGLVTTNVLKKLGCDVVTINAETDGTFPNRKPEPTNENLAFLQKRVVETKADFGVALDGDADRSVFLDNTGRILDGSTMSTFFAKEILQKNKNAYIVASIDTSSTLKTVVEENKGNLVWCPVGMNNISQGLIENKGMFAGEVSSHFYFNDYYPFSDGTLATIKLAQILSEKNEKMSQLINELPHYPIMHQKFNMQTHEKKIQTFEKIKKEVTKKYEVNTIDGVKFFLNKTDWILIRPSNTEPLIRLTVEAKDEKSLKKYIELYSKLITKFL